MKKEKRGVTLIYPLPVSKSTPLESALCVGAVFAFGEKIYSGITLPESNIAAVMDILNDTTNKECDVDNLIRHAKGKIFKGDAGQIVDQVNALDPPPAGYALIWKPAMGWMGWSSICAGEMREPIAGAGSPTTHFEDLAMNLDDEKILASLVSEVENLDADTPEEITKAIETVDQAIEAVKLISATLEEKRGKLWTKLDGMT